MKALLRLASASGVIPQIMALYLKGRVHIWVMILLKDNCLTSHAEGSNLSQKLILKGLIGDRGKF